MSQQLETSGKPITDWQVEILRLTAFPQSTFQLKDLDLWSQVTGQPPAEKITRIRLGAQRELGPILGGILITDLQPNRIDWVLTSAEEREPTETGFSTIAAFSELLPPFVELMIKWLNSSSCPSLQRLAFGAVLIIPIDTKDEGYHKLSTYLPGVQLDPKDSFDFLYQINRPRKSVSKTEGLFINRLSKWSVSKVQRLQLSVRPTSDVLSSNIPPYFACRLEVDINTSQDFKGPLPQRLLPNIFQELADLARQIAEKGDIP
jgi:hypothetical protein